VSVINEKKDGVVFMLWGTYAQKKGAVIDRSRHLVLTAPHPSPLSAYRGFLGCRHFSRCNEYLKSRGKTPVNWQCGLTMPFIHAIPWKTVLPA
jgi:uracil-DNA glycosylase